MALDVFDLWAKIGFDSSEYDRGLDEAEKKANGFGDKLGAAFGVAAKAIAAATAAATTGAAALVKQSVDAYANQEQLIGGIETLFSNLEGTVSAAPIVLENAANAYKTAGMSANQYMETVTSFSAALIAGLEGDYQKAAEVSDMAISDMADNANRMGTSLSSIQLAYQGFSRQQYQLLDNLRLGYGGTKTEMERLLADAEKISGIKYDISNLSDVYNAIHVIQQEMGITGTTAKEANDTISGSMGQLSGAWANLVAGFADSQADIPALINNVVEVAEVSFGNLLPVVEQAIGGVAEFVEDIAPIVVEKLPDVVDQVVPPLLNAADTIVGALVETLPTLLGAVVDVIPGTMTDISSKVIEIMPQIAELGLTFVTTFARGIADNTPALITATTDAVHKVALQLTNRDTLRDIMDAGLDIVVALADGVAENISTLAETAGFIIGSIVDYLTSEDFLPKLRDAGEDILDALGEGIEEHFPIIGGVISGLADNFDGLITVVETAAIAFGTYKAAAAISGVIDTVRNSVQLLTTAQMALNGAMSANVFGVVAAGIAGAAYLISKSVTAIKDAGTNIEEITGKIDAVAESAKGTLRDLDNLTDAQRRVIADDLTESIEQAKNDLTEATAQISEGFFRYRDDVLGESDNAIRSFAEQYKGIVEDVNNEGFVFKFDGTEDVEYVQQVLNDLMTAIQNTGEDVGELSTMYNSIYDASTQLKDAADNIDTLIIAQKRLANYAPTGTGANFIPTEALRQMEGKAAPILTPIGEQVEVLGDKTVDLGEKIEETGEKAETAGEKVKEALTFDTKAIGEYRNLGVVEVLGKALSEEDEKAKKIADTVFTASQQYVERQTNTLDLSLKEQIEMWESVQAQFVEGSEQYLKAGDKIVALQKKQATELANEAKKTANEQKRAYDDRVNAIKDYQKQVDKIYSEIEDIEQKYTDALAERTSDIYDSFGLFEKVPDRVLYSGQDLIANVQGQVATLQKWVNDLAKLEARGVDAETITELRTMGVGAADQIDALLDLTDSELDTWVAAVGEKRKLAADTATSELADVAQETADKVNEKLGEAADLTKDTAKNLGMSISEMIAEGITDGAAVIATAAQSALSFAGIDMSSFTAEPSNAKAPSTNKLTDAVRSAFGIGTSIFGMNNASGTVGETTASSSPQTTAANNSGESAQTTKITQKITVNINGVQYQNLNDLTQAISEELERLMTREVGYGVA